MDIKYSLLTSHKYLTTLVGHIFLVAALTACNGGVDDGNNGGTNSAPVASDTGFSVLPGNTYTGSLPASDADGDSLNYATVTSPGNGTLTITDPATGAFSYTLNGAASGDTFTFLANDGELDSNIATVTITGTIPATPTGGLQTTNGDQRVTLNWDTVPGADAYNIYWSNITGTGTGGTQISGVTPPFYHDGLTNGSNYYYVITAVNAVGESAASAELSATPFDILISSLTFTDSNLFNCVTTEAALLTYVHQLTNLDCSFQGITDLSGIEALSSLVNLNLLVNSITDISPLTSLTNLSILNLTRNNISNAGPLASLPGLTNLYMGTNNISDVSPLAGLTTLTSLDIGSNNVSDISSLSTLTGLTWLELDVNNISDISSLSGMSSLNTLSLMSNSVTDISPLSGKTGLTALYLYDNSISDITSLSGLTGLSILWLNRNSISDVSPLATLTGVTQVRLENNNIGGQGIGNVDSLTSLLNPSLINLTFNIGMSCSELATLITAQGSPPVDTNNNLGTPDVATNGVNCTNP